MSADNWAICPRCEAKRQDEIRAMDIDIANAYGSVSVEEFDRLRAERDARANETPSHSFREDYEIWGVEDGEFHVSYRGGCRECGFEHKFSHDDVLDVEARP